MAVLGALGGSGGGWRPAGECSYVCLAHMRFHLLAHAHMRTHTHKRPRVSAAAVAAAVILMGAECYFIPPLVTAVSGRCDEWGEGSRRERERDRE